MPPCLTSPQCPLQDRAAIAAGADGPAMLADESLDGGGAVHVGDGHDQLIRAALLQLLPAVQRLLEIGHVGHGAPSPEIGEDDADAWVRQDISGLSHEMNAAEDDKLDSALLGGFPRQFVAVPGEIGEGDDAILLVVMSEDDQPMAEALPGRPNPPIELGVGEPAILFWNCCLPHFHSFLAGPRSGLLTLLSIW
jgi:hypothetical protein